MLSWTHSRMDSCRPIEEGMLGGPSGAIELKVGKKVRLATGTVAQITSIQAQPNARPYLEVAGNWYHCDSGKAVDGSDSHIDFTYRNLPTAARPSQKF